MRAKLLNPAGPPWTRYAPFSVGCACLAGAFAAPVASLGLLVVASALWHFSPLIVGRRPMRTVELDLGAGRVAVTGAGVLTQTVRARDLEGASTARVADGVALTLMRRDRDGHATELVLPSDEDAHKVREALGIGHHGFGVLAWPSEPKVGFRLEVAARVLGFVVSLAFLTTMGLSPDLGEAGPFLTVIASLLLFGTSITVGASVAERKNGPQVVMRADGLHARIGSQWRIVPYALIAGVTHDEEALTIELHGNPAVKVPIRCSRWTHRGLAGDELDMLTAQLLSAAQRAQGAGPEKPPVAARVDVLARGADPPAQWLARVDAAVAGIGRTGYRGGAIEVEDLWQTLLDPEADVSMRAGAARALVRIAPDTAPSRVESALAAVRDAHEAKRIRVALLPDIDEASRELEELDRTAVPRAPAR